MSSSATSTCLPQELVDNIIGELKDDVASLRACSLVSKPWVYRSRKYLFETVRLPRCLLLKWLARIPASPVPPLGPHHHVRSLTLQPIKVPAVFCIQETLVDHLSSFTQLSNLDITGSHWAGWVDAFSDSVLVAKCFGGFGQTLRKLELTRVYLNLGALKALLDVFPHLEQLLIFSPMMVGEGANSVGALPHLRKHQDVAEAESSNMMAPRELTPVRFIDAITLLFPPTTLVLGVTGWPLHCRELVLMVDSDYGGDASKLLLDSTGPTLESLVIRNTIDTGLTLASLENCPVLRQLKTKAPYHEVLVHINAQARLIQTVTSPLLERIVFSGNWKDSQMGETIDWLEPSRWEIVDRELCNLMDRSDEGVKLQVFFADGESSGGREFDCVGFEKVAAGSAYAMLLNGVMTRGGTVMIQRVEELVEPCV